MFASVRVSGLTALRLVLMMAAALMGACSSPASPSPPPVGISGPVLVGAGDIALCGSNGAENTARLLDGIEGTVFTAGDNAYPHGSAADYAECYQPTWGRHRGRTRPTPGNHEYETPNARAYFDYFGAAAGAPSGYYSYTLGSWHIVALNSEIDVRASSAQAQWLRADLAGNPGLCTAAIWHRPLFTSGPNGDAHDMQDIFRLLYDANADVVINGHDHLYERFAPQDADGRADSVRGIRQFTVGTGGMGLYQPISHHLNSEAVASVWGVLKLTLGADEYAWEFVPASGSNRDSGSGSCH
jgi:hypothetical protein